MHPHAQIPGLREGDPEVAAFVEAAHAKTLAEQKAKDEAAAAADAVGAGALLPPSPAGGDVVTPLKGGRDAANAAGFPTAMPSTPSNPNMLFSTINAETLESSAQQVSFPIPDEKVRGGGGGEGGPGRQAVRAVGRPAASAWQYRN